LRLGGMVMGLPNPNPQFGFEDARWIREVLASPKVAYRAEIDDAHLHGVLDARGLLPQLISIVPMFDYGRLRYVLLGQGLDQDELKRHGREIKPYLDGISEALRIVSLRELV